jgi:hypothetical protein
MMLTVLHMLQKDRNALVILALHNVCICNFTPIMCQLRDHEVFARYFSMKKKKILVRGASVRLRGPPGHVVHLLEQLMCEP